MTSFSTGLRAWQRRVIEAADDRNGQRDRRERILLAIAAAFIFSNTLAFNLLRQNELAWEYFWPSLVWLLVVVVAHLLISVFKPERDPFLLPLFALLGGWSLLLQTRLAPNFLARQTLWFVLGAAALLAVAILPRSLRALQRYRYVLLTSGLILLAITLLFGVNPSGSGAALWLPLPFIGRVFFQPSELLKLLLVIFLAGYFTEQEPYYRLLTQNRSLGPPGWRESLRRQIPFLGPLLLMWGFTIILLIWQQDLGAAGLFFIVFITLLYLATGVVRYVILGLLMLIAAGAGMYFVFDTVATPRIVNWLNPWANPATTGYQIIQSILAQAAGGVLGQGIGQGFPDFIPVVHSDFVLAAVAEEWGLLGSLTLIIGFALLTQRGFRMAILALRTQPKNLFHAYIAAGISVMLATQAFLIMGGVTKLIPLTGITLPFVSYGGSSLLVSSLMVGLLIYLSAATTQPAESETIPLARRISLVSYVILTGFFVVAASMGYWAVWRSNDLLAREENPRLVEAERRIRRGRILDRNGVVLAESVGQDSVLTRVYPLADSGPAVGYYNWRYGTVGTEQVYDPVLRGGDMPAWEQALSRFIHRPPVGRDVRLTLDAGLQEMAAAAMAGRTGALVLLEAVPDGEAAVRAYVSQPGYDPNELEDKFESLAAEKPGRLFDRAAQGRYQPGLILQPLILAAMVEEGQLRLDDPVGDADLPVTINGQVLRCAVPGSGDTPVDTDWVDMIRRACPAPLHALGQRVGAATLTTFFDQWGLNSPPEFILPVGEAAADQAVGDPGLAAIGQEGLTVSPLQVARAYGAFMSGGNLPALRLGDAIATEEGGWQMVGTETKQISPLISDDVGSLILQSLPRNGAYRGHAVSVLAGPVGNRDVWFAGLAPSGTPRFVLVLVIEDEAEAAAAELIGRGVLEAAVNQP